MSYDLPERYNFDLLDRDLLAAASDLLKNMVTGGILQHAEMASVAKLQHVLSHLPRATLGLDVKVNVQSPRHKFGEIETWHWWQVAVEDDQLSLSSGGHFSHPCSGGDSFSTMSWRATPGEQPSEFIDYRTGLAIVPDVQSFQDGIASIDFTAESFQVEIFDEDNPLLDEMKDIDEEDYPTKDECASSGEDKESKTDLEPQQPWLVKPEDDVETLLASMVDPAEVGRNEPQYAYGVKVCDFCGCSLSTRGVFVDGCLRDQVMWGNMCARCFNAKGAGIGWGKGQLFARQQDGGWLMVAGFRQ